MQKTLAEMPAYSKRVRAEILKMIAEAGSGHPGGSLSVTDILLVLYHQVMRRDPLKPDWMLRDRLILSKGHAAPALYTILIDLGYIPESERNRLRVHGGILQGHPDRRLTPGVEVSSGSLGNGLSVASGLACAGKLDKADWRVYCILGDGECDEGLVWGAAMFAAHYRLDNLTAVVDRNRLQIDGPTEKVCGLEPLTEKWRSFKWNVICVDGHDHRQLADAFAEAKTVKGQPTVVIAETTKGKGISFMEGVVGFHGKPPNKQELETALRELEVG